MKHTTLQLGLLFTFLCTSTHMQYAVSADVVKQKLFYTYNLIDNFVTKQEQLDESQNIPATEFSRLHHKLVRKMLHWIMGGKQYVASDSVEYAKIGAVLDLTYVILQESHPYSEEEFEQTYGFSLHDLKQTSYSESEIINIGTFVSSTLLWQGQEKLLALCNEYLQSRK